MLSIHSPECPNMGAACTCSRQPDRFQIITNEAVVAKQSFRLSSLHDSALNSAPVSQELAAYLEENKTYMNKKITQLFLSAIQQPASSLSSIQLKLCSMKDSDWVHFSTLITHCKDAASLFMVWKTQVSPPGFDFLCSYFSLFTHLNTLILEDIDLAHQKFALFVESLKRLDTLTVLSLAVNRLTSEHLELLFPAFAVLEKITNLSLDENLLGDQGCELIRDHLEVMQSLNTLGLRYNGVNAQGACCLLSLVQVRHGVKIYADGNEIDVRDLERLKSGE